jgi:hypothetical protein
LSETYIFTVFTVSHLAIKNKEPPIQRLYIHITAKISQDKETWYWYRKGWTEQIQYLYHMGDNKEVQEVSRRQEAGEQETGQETRGQEIGRQEEVGQTGCQLTGSGWIDNNQTGSWQTGS